MQVRQRDTLREKGTEKEVLECMAARDLLDWSRSGGTPGGTADHPRTFRVLVGILRMFTVAVRSTGQSSVLVTWRRESFHTSIMTMVTGAETVGVISTY